KAIAVSLHGDEGTSKRSKNVLVISISPLGCHREAQFQKYPFVVVRSDRFAFDGKKNLTLSCLQKALVDSMLLLSSKDDPELHGWSLHLTVSKGDWKHKREWLMQTRHYANLAGPNGQLGQICPRCFADSSRDRPWADISERFNNQQDLDDAASSSSS
ncbi:Cpr, partial [Symbiodinium sp. CCMP2456]